MEAASTPILPKTIRPSHRCLLVVETSKAMQRRTAGVNNAIQELLRSEMKGQLRDGDTLGLWTFNDELAAGQFPLQHWSASSSGEITAQVQSFLSAITNEGPARIEKVLGPVQQLLAKSELMTVILVTSGEQPITGSPFDDQINEIYRLWAAEQQRTQMPFLTLLRSTQGRVMAFAVTPAPWPLEMPALPKESPRNSVGVVKTDSRSTSPELVSPKTRQAIIFSGSNPEPRSEGELQAPILRPSTAKPLDQPSSNSVAEVTSQALTNGSAITEQQRSIEPEPVLVGTGSKDEPKTRSPKQEQSPSVQPASNHADHVAITMKAPVLSEGLANAEREASPVEAAVSQEKAAEENVQPEATEGPKELTTAANMMPEVPVLEEPMTSKGNRQRADITQFTVRITAVGVAISAFAAVLIFRRNPKPRPQGSLITRSLESACWARLETSSENQSDTQQRNRESPPANRQNSRGVVGATSLVESGINNQIERD
jgi:hypothetical protein